MYPEVEEASIAHILGFGGYVPEKVMTNADWAAIVDTSEEWLVQRTGIRERRIASESQSTVDLCEPAALLAIADASLDIADIGEVIVATDTPEARIPDTASYLQHRLGLGEVPAYDLAGSGCAGFVMALDVARARLALEPKNILVLGVEIISKVIAQDDRATSVLFGDGAGAIVLGPGPGPAEVIDAVGGTDGSMTEILKLDIGGTRYPFGPDVLASGAYNQLIMDGSQVFRHAVKRMSASTLELLQRVGASVDNIDLLIPHQANQRIIDAVGKRIGIGTDRVYVNVDRLGNTGSGSVPIALWEAYSAGQISKGDFVVLTAFGAGFHWASAALQF